MGDRDADERAPRSRSRSPARAAPTKGEFGGEGGPRKTGICVGWNHKGFGFIRPDEPEPDSTDDLFCHCTQIRDGNALEKDAKVEYETVFDDRRNKYRAVEVSGGKEVERTYFPGEDRGRDDRYDRGPPPRRDDRRGYDDGYDRRDRRSYDDRYDSGPPRRDDYYERDRRDYDRRGYDDDRRGGGRYDDRDYDRRRDDRYDDRRYDDRRPPPRDDRGGYDRDYDDRRAAPRDDRGYDDRR